MPGITIDVTLDDLANFFGFPVDATQADALTVLRNALDEYAVASESAAIAVSADPAHRGPNFAQVRDEHLKREAIARRILDALPPQE